MTLPGNILGTARLTSSWRGLLIVLAVSFLAVNVVTRYGTTGYEASGVRTASVVKAASPQPLRQRLLSNGLNWMAPAPTSAFFQSPRISVPAVSAEFPAINLESESWLYNRPPPSC